MNITDGTCALTLGLLFVAACTTAKDASSIPTASATEPTTRRSPEDLVGALHTAFGEHHARAVHTKGIALEGQFTPDPSAASLTTARHFQTESSHLQVRFSNFTGLPDIPDDAPQANPRGLAVKFEMSGGFTTDIVAHSFDGFPTATSDEFRDLLLAIAASGPSSPAPTPLDEFLGRHPIAKTFLTTQKTPASYATIGYFGVNAFEMTNAKGESHFVRYQFVPEEGEHLANGGSRGAMYLQTELRERIARAPFRFKLYAQVAERGDAIADPSIAWPSSRARIALGTLEVRALAPDTVAADKALAFSPANVPAGIKPADPMVTFRHRAYPISVKERQ